MPPWVKTMLSDEDHVVEVLSEVCQLRGNEVDPTLLRKTYEILKKHQHSLETNASLEELRRLVEQFVRDNLASEGARDPR
jgi:hypothetical protein